MDHRNEREVNFRLQAAADKAARDHLAAVQRKPTQAPEPEGVTLQTLLLIAVMGGVVGAFLVHVFGG